MIWSKITMITNFENIYNELNNKNNIKISGLSSSAKSLFISLLHEKTKKNILFITSDEFSAETYSEGISICSGNNIPVSNFVFSDNTDNNFSLSEAEKKFKIIVTDIYSALKKIESPEKLKDNSLSIKVGESISPVTLSERLVDEGFQKRSITEERKDFSQRGGIFDIYPVNGEPIRLEFFGSKIDSIRIFDIETQRSQRKISEVTIYFPKYSKDSSAFLADYFDKRNTIIIKDEPALLKLSYLESETWENIRTREDFSLDEDGDFDFEPIIDENQNKYAFNEFEKHIEDFQNISFADWGTIENINIDISQAPSFGKKVSDFVDFVKNSDEKSKFLVVSPQALRIADILSESKISVTKLLSPNSGLINQLDFQTKVATVKKNFSEGFCINHDFYIVTDRELFGVKRKNSKKVSKKVPMKLEDLTIGDYIIHSTHGVGVYRGLETKEINGYSSEFLKLEYAGGDFIFIPVEQIYLLEKYDLEDEEPKLSKMGAKEWQKKKAKVKEEVEKIAKQLLDIYAKRNLAEGHAFSADTPWQKEMEEAFPYVETPDQIRAIQDAKRDMEAPHPMERLICGDAGYGKTEIALRCAFKAVMDGKQVAILAPTTLLAEQHYEVFSERFASFPVRIELLSRFRTKAKQQESVLNMATGKSDIVIGTHRLLSKDVSFSDLGLVIIDEEQFFGVMHKEKLREMSAGVDTLILSATPIPRTLHLTMSGVKDLSVITTPPQDRLPVKTYIMPFRKDAVKGAIMREKARGGQVFFLHNRVEGIETITKEIENLIPNIKITYAHAQMSEAKLEKIMKDFSEGLYDVLVCTTIIQSGIDMPNVNTIIINNAYSFGLAQLYQIRGRVGRSHHRAYAYLMYPQNRLLTSDAKKRMEVLRDFTELGSGFHIAMKDLEMRGTGDILGKAQHGFVKSVGFSLYCRMLSEAVEELKGNKNLNDSELLDPKIDIPLSAYIPDFYVADQKQKLTIYRKIGQIKTFEEIDDLKVELKDRFGKMPEETYNLFDVAKIKILMKKSYIPRLYYSGKNIVISAPFLSFGKNQIEKMRSKGIPLGITEGKITMLDILHDEYWVEILIDYLELLNKIPLKM